MARGGGADSGDGAGGKKRSSVSAAADNKRNRKDRASGNGAAASGTSDGSSDGISAAAGGSGAAAGGAGDADKASLGKRKEVAPAASHATSSEPKKPKSEVEDEAALEVRPPKATWEPERKLPFDHFGDFGPRGRRNTIYPDPGVWCWFQLHDDDSRWFPGTVKAFYPSGQVSLDVIWRGAHGTGSQKDLETVILRQVKPYVDELPTKMDPLPADQEASASGLVRGTWVLCHIEGNVVMGTVVETPSGSDPMVLLVGGDVKTISGRSLRVFERGPWQLPVGTKLLFNKVGTGQQTEGTYIPAYLPAYLLTYLLAYLPTCLLTYLLTYVPTY